MKWKALRQRDSCLNAIGSATLPSYEACRVRFALSTVFDKSIVMVIGPTPPGTGVMNAARSLASLNATSPTRRYPRFFVASFTRRCTFSHVGAHSQDKQQGMRFSQAAKSMPILVAVIGRCVVLEQAGGYASAPGS